MDPDNVESYNQLGQKIISDLNKRETFVLRTCQYLGFFPVNIRINDTGKGQRVRKLLQFFPPVFFCLMALTNVIAFFTLHNYLNSTKFDFRGRQSALGSGTTVASSVFLKTLSHLFTTIYMMSSILIKRKRLAKFYTELLSLIAELSPGITLNDCHCKYNDRLRKDLIFYLLMAASFSAELLIDALKGNYISKYIVISGVPVALGYINSTFAFLLVFFMNWHLELVEKIRVSWKQCNAIQNWLGNKQPNSDIKLLFQQYNRLRHNATEFGRLFGPWIIVDMSHCIIRIVISAYYAGSLTIIGLTQNLSTVLIYSYLLFMVCQKGSDLAEESSDFVDEVGTYPPSSDERIWKLGNDFNRANVPLNPIKAIKIRTSFFKLDFGLIPSIVGTIATYLLVLLQFQGNDDAKTNN